MASISTPAAPQQADGKAHSGFQHFVQFYDDDAALSNPVSRYLGSGLDAGESVLVIATDSHRRGIEGRLREQGCDIAHYRATGQYTCADAEELLSGFMNGGRPQQEPFEHMVGGLLRQAASRSRRLRVRAFGEMVACLWASGQQAAALDLEALWNELPCHSESVPSFALCCGYPLRSFRGPGQTDGFLSVCGKHSRVLPARYDEDASRETLLRAMAQLQQRAVSLEDFVGRLIDAQEEERRRIGRALDEGVAQKLALLAIGLDRSQEHREAGAASLAEQASALWDQVNEISEDVHHLSSSLHSTVLEELGLLPGLRSLIAEFSERHGILVHFQADPLPKGLAADLTLCLYRVAQEGLSNVAKHSGACSARVTVACTADEIHLTIQDNGVGFDPTMIGTQSGLGMIHMRERLRKVRGTMEIHSAPSAGARVVVRVPLKPSDRSDSA